MCISGTMLISRHMVVCQRPRQTRGHIRKCVVDTYISVLFTQLVNQPISASHNSKSVELISTKLTYFSARPFIYYIIPHIRTKFERNRLKQFLKYGFLKLVKFFKNKFLCTKQPSRSSISMKFCTIIALSKIYYISIKFHTIPEEDMRDS